jgi:hypothetical protein
MGITSLSGPRLSYGLSQSSTGAVSDYNDERGPDVSDLGYATLDPRYQYNYDPGSPVGTQVKSFFNNQAAVNYVPMTAQTSALYISSQVSSAVAGTPFVLLAASSALGTYATTIIAPESGKVSESLIALDSTAAVVTWGSGGTVATWNPAAGTGRTIQLTVTSTGPDVGWLTVKGRDMYGFKMTENIPIGIASTSVSSVAGKKAFKYIYSLTPSASTTITSTGWGVGFADVFGLPLLATFNSNDTQCRINATSSGTANPAQSNISITAGATATATSTTGDVRGTWASSVASNATARVSIYQNITPAAANSVSATDTSALFGVTQYSNF